ncbi:hypothetical protein HDV00_000414 [Rhizophlyctis rosea]|nr:hypothetical protein HDV00_000414 [Rhizophlyctis rosea]
MPNLLSALAGYASVVCWLVVYTPQIYENYSRKSTGGLSLTFVIIWLVGDLFNLAGALLHGLLFTVILLAIYYTICDMILLGQWYFYDILHKGHSIFPTPQSETVSDDERDERSPLLEPLTDADSPTTRHPVGYDSVGASSTDLANGRKARGVTMLVLGALVALSFGTGGGSGGWERGGRVGGLQEGGIPGTPPPVVGDPSHAYPDIHMIANIFGYLSAACYVGSRFPQIVHNFRHRSCEGLSLLMFAFSVMGNVTYCLSIFFESLDAEWLVKNIPWLIGSGGTLLLDFIILGQFYVYRGQSPTTRVEKDAENGEVVA